MKQVMENESVSKVWDKSFSWVSGAILLGVISGAFYLMDDNTANAEKYAGLKTVVVEEGVSGEPYRLTLGTDISTVLADTLADADTKSLKASKAVYGKLDKTVEMTLKNKTTKFEVYKKGDRLTLVGNGFGVIEGAKDRESVYTIGMFNQKYVAKWLQNRVL